MSNFTIDLLEQSFKLIGKDQIATNQVEVHPYLQNRKVVEFCKQQNLHITAYMPLARGKILTDATIQSIANKHNTNPVDITLSWLLAQGFAVIPSSKKRKNLESNLSAGNIALDQDDIKLIESLNINERIVNPDFAPKWN